MEDVEDVGEQPRKRAHNRTEGWWKPVQSLSETVQINRFGHASLFLINNIGVLTFPSLVASNRTHAGFISNHICQVVFSPVDESPLRMSLWGKTEMRVRSDEMAGCVWSVQCFACSLIILPFGDSPKKPGCFFMSKGVKVRNMGLSDEEENIRATLDVDVVPLGW